MTTLQLAPLPGATPALAPLFQHVVLAIDFGSASLAAARWATTNVARRAHAILSHVIPLRERVGDAISAVEPGHEEFTERRPTLLGGLEGFAATLELASARAVLRIGQPSRCLSALANDGAASLLVLGRRSDANRKRVGEPNVIERLARRVTTSVLVVPEGVSQPPTHVVAAVDDSAFAPAVLGAARWLARLHACPLTVLHVLQPAAGAYDRVMRSGRRALPDGRSAARTPSLPALRTMTRRLVELVAADASRDDVRFEVAVGDPTSEIVGTALGRGAPLVVVGQRGADGAPAGSLGSVTRELLTRAPLAVVSVGV
ncbi:MAG: universal stress protein [Gemmatimonadaceae bacterium]